MMTTATLVQPASVSASAAVPDSVQRRSVVELLYAAVRDHADTEALVFGPLRLSYAEYGHAVSALVSVLEAVGAGEGKRVATLLGNSDMACIAAFAVLASGAEFVPLNPVYTDRELGYILNDAQPAWLLCEDADQARLQQLYPQAEVWTVSETRARMAAQSGAYRERALPQAHQPALLQYTGGTTGHPKGVCLSHGALATNVEQREQVLPTLTACERIVCVMPLFHSYAMAMGLFLAARCAGCLVVLPRYHPEALLKTVVEERISVFPGSPTLFAGLMGHEKFAQTDWSSVRLCYSGSAPLSEATLQRWEQAVGAPIYEGYGQTEAGPILTYNGPQVGTKVGSVGRALAGTEVQIVDLETGNTVLPVGERGEIRARGPQVMTGYLGLPDATAETLRDGWLYTGDIGEFDADGFLFIRDRKKDLVIVGGYNVYPREIDEVLYLHPKVSEAAAFGVPDAYRGEVIVACVVPQANATLSEEEVLQHCATNLARYKVPTVVRVVTQLPRTAANKVDKRQLKQDWVAQQSAGGQ